MTGTTCLWCSRTFTPRRDGGKAQRFCRETCRRSFDAAGRRWIAGAIATGMLTVDTLRNGPAATRALLPGDILPLPNIPAEKPTPVAPAEPRDEAAKLLDDFLIAVFDLPRDAWPDRAAALPDELYDRIADTSKSASGNPESTLVFERHSVNRDPARPARFFPYRLARVRACVSSSGAAVAVISSDADAHVVISCIVTIVL